MFDFEKISASKIYAAPPLERVVEFSPPGIDLDNVSKALSLNVDARCVDAEAFEGYAQVSGRTTFRLAYLDGSGAPKGVEYNADFTAKVEGDFLAGDSLDVDVRILESDVEADAQLKLSCALEISVSAVRREEIEALVGSDDCYVTKKEVYLPNFIASKSISVNFDDEKQAAGEITGVLGVSVCASAKQAVVSAGSVDASATLFAIVTYLEDGDIKTKEFRITLDEQLGIDGAEEGDAVLFSAQVKSSKVVLQGVTDDNVLRLEGEVAFKLQVFRCAKVQIAGDVMSLTHELEVSSSSFDLLCFDGSGYFSERVGGTAMLADNRAAAKDVVALPYARCYASKASVNEDGGLDVEGVVNTDIIYSDENGYNSVRAEIPFAVELKSEKPFSKDVRVRCVVEDISASVKREREFELDAALGIYVSGYSPLKGSYISAVEAREEKPQNKSAISLYISREGDDVMDLCKALTAMPDDILEQNPTLTFPLAAGEKVVYFRHLDM